MYLKSICLTIGLTIMGTLGNLLCIAQSPTLLKDIHSLGGDPRHLTALNGKLYFTAKVDGKTTSLWKSDGTSTTTVKVTDLPGTAYSLTAVGNILFFVTDQVNFGFELWKSDGTATGTVRVKDIYVGSVGSMPSGLTAVGNTLYFVANDGINGDELWKSDGTAAGTVLVKNIVNGAAGSNPQQLTAIGNKLFFAADDGQTGLELWTSDGTLTGTTLLKDIYVGSRGSSPRSFTAIGSTVYFVAENATNGFELWKTNQTAAGTILVKDINIGTAHALPHFLTNFNNTLYFVANDGQTGVELWKSNGTATGTTLVKDINIGTNGSQPQNLTISANQLFFGANNGNNNFELWRTDGTTANTKLVKDIVTNPDIQTIAPYYLTNLQNSLFFVARNNAGFKNEELWKSDGRTDGTVILPEIYKGATKSSVREITTIGTNMYFVADNGINGSELWKVVACNLAATIINKPTAKLCGNTTYTLQATTSGCLGAAYQWYSKTLSVSSQDTILRFNLPTVQTDTRHKIYFKASYGLESVLDSVEITIMARAEIKLIVTDTTVCHKGPMSLPAMVVNASQFSYQDWRIDSLHGPTLSKPTATMLKVGDNRFYVIATGLNGCQDTSTVLIRCGEIQSIGSLKILLEGAYSPQTRSMTADLNLQGLLPGQVPVYGSGIPTPPQQPYYNAPWNYKGNESQSTYSPTITDWVLVSLRTDPLASSSTIFKRATLVDKDGLVAEVRGCPNQLKYYVPYYIVVEHRNHIGVVSATPIMFLSSQPMKFYYDFTTKQSYIPYGIGQKIVDGKYMMYAGDINKNAGISAINALDATAWRTHNGKIGMYIAADANLDGEVNAMDYLYWLRNNGFFSGIMF